MKYTSIKRRWNATSAVVDVVRAGGLVAGPEPSKLMARVQIPAGTFSAERREPKIAKEI